jgi:thiosulfate/3-mercaptopyruvate sulfurtransferase
MRAPTGGGISQRGAAGGWIDLVVWTLVVLALDSSPRSSRAEEVLRELSTQEVRQRLEDADWVVVDTRIPDAYNGWALEGLPRGGHLPGSVDFSARWLDAPTKRRDERLREAMRVKRISAELSILLCDANGRDHQRVAEYLRRQGCERLAYYPLQGWAGDPALPLDRYPEYWRLVPPAVVRQLLDGQRPETFRESVRVRMLEASWGDASASYDKGHVPTSVHVNTDAIEPPPRWMLGSPAVLRRAAGNLGLRHDDTVIVSGENPMAAHRLAVVLLYVGVRDVRVLNGGLTAWKLDGCPLETTRNEPPARCEFGREIPAGADWIDSLEEIRAKLGDADRFLLADVRSRREYDGEVSGYSYWSRKGRIPGAIFAYGGPDADSLDFYRNVDDTMRNAAEIQRLWKEAGIDTEKHISFMCGSGWRAAEVLHYARVMGLERTSLYSNGWIEWSSQPGNPTLP